MTALRCALVLILLIPAATDGDGSHAISMASGSATSKSTAKEEGRAEAHASDQGTATNGGEASATTGNKGGHATAEADGIGSVARAYDNSKPTCSGTKAKVKSDGEIARFREHRHLAGRGTRRGRLRNGHHRGVIRSFR